MIKLKLSLVFTFLILTLGTTWKDNESFQVISSHPHDIKKLMPHVETVLKEGRLWIVRLKNDAPTGLKQFLKPVSGRERTYSYVGIEKSLRPEPIDSIVNLISNTDSEAIRKDVETLSQFKSRAAGTVGNKEALKFIKQRLSSLHLKVQEICYQVDRCSLIAERSGTRAPEKVLMIMAHMDSVGASFAGADDNASGTAVLLEIARVLKDYPNKKTLRFFVTNGEELGLLGAKHYAEKLSVENKLNELEFVINMDMVGYNSNGIVELETDPEYEYLGRWFSELVDTYTKLSAKITLGAWGSDHVPFLKKGVPALLTIEDWDTNTPCYHKSCDLPDTLNYEYTAEISKLNTSALMLKDI